jgi:hypothetical protein
MDVDGGVVAAGRAEIDTRAPFKSVKEAVALFGEKVLAGELLHGGRRINTEVRASTGPPSLISRLYRSSFDFSICMHA